MNQAKRFEIKPDFVFYFKVSEECCVNRILGRNMGREDDTEEVARRRVEIYKKETEPLVEYYSDMGVLYEIDGEKDIAEIFRKLCSMIDELMKE